MWFYYYDCFFSVKVRFFTSLDSNVVLLLRLNTSIFIIPDFPLDSNVVLLLLFLPLSSHAHFPPLDSNVVLLLLDEGTTRTDTMNSLDSNVVLLLPIHSQYSKNKHFSTPICRPAKITACFITLTFNHADNFYISRLYSAYCRPPGVFTL